MSRRTSALVLACLALAGAGAAAPGELTRRERLRLAAEADALLQKKDYEAAAERLLTAAGPGADKDDLAHWYPVLGRCYEAMNNFPKALAAYQEAYKLRPKALPQMLDLARLYGLVGLNESAIELYRKALERDRGQRDVVLALATLYFAAGRVGPAKEHVERFLRWEPHHLGAQALMARVEEAQGDLAAAAHLWEGILARQPGAEEYFHLGLLWSRQGEYDLAEAAFKKARAHGMAEDACLLQQGLLAWYRGKDPAAVRRWKEALRENPALMLPKFFLALDEYQNGRAQPAAALMRQVQEQASSPYVKELARRFQELAARPGR